MLKNQKKLKRKNILKTIKSKKKKIWNDYNNEKLRKERRLKWKYRMNSLNSVSELC